MVDDELPLRLDAAEPARSSLGRGPRRGLRHSGRPELTRLRIPEPPSCGIALLTLGNSHVLDSARSHTATRTHLQL